MIDKERNLSTTYRITRHSAEGGVILKVFPNVPDPVSEGWYRMDQIPQWMIEAMALLDAAAPASIPDIGHRLGEMVYWIEPPLRNTAGDRISSLLTEVNNRGWEVVFAEAMDETREAWRMAGVT